MTATQRSTIASVCEFSKGMGSPQMVIPDNQITMSYGSPVQIRPGTVFTWSPPIDSKVSDIQIQNILHT